MARHDITKNIIKHHGRYHLRKMLHGEHHLVDLHTMSLRTAKARARAEWRDILNREANGGIAKAKAYRSVPTLGEVSKVYLAATVGPKAVTRRHNLYCLRRLAVDVLGITHAAADKMRVNEVANVDLLAAWINQRKATPPKLSRHEAATRAPHELSKPGRLTPYDLNTVLITIEGAIKHARGVFSERSMHKDFGCLRNFNIPDLGGFMSLPLPEYEARIYRPPSPEEIGRVIEALPALEEKSPAVFVAILLGIGLGLRRGEIQHARWSMIEWVEGIPVLVIGATHDWAGTKGKHERRVEIAPSVYRKLIEHKGNETFIVPDARGMMQACGQPTTGHVSKGAQRNAPPWRLAKQAPTHTARAQAALGGLLVIAAGGSNRSGGCGAKSFTRCANILGRSFAPRPAFMRPRNCLAIKTSRPPATHTPDWLSAYNSRAPLTRRSSSRQRATARHASAASVDKWGIVRGQLSLCPFGAVWVYFHRAKVFEIL